MPKGKKKKAAPKKKEKKKVVAKKPAKKELKELEAAKEKAETAAIKEEAQKEVQKVEEAKAEPQIEVKEEVLEKKEETMLPREKKTEHYYFGTGRRKTSIAKVRLFQGKGDFVINGRPLNDYLGGRKLLEIIVRKPLKLTGNSERFDVSVSVLGGGTASQADAIGHGISRALLQVNPDLKPSLKKEGLLTRDPRMKERKKYGRKRARKRFQYSKR